MTPITLAMAAAQGALRSPRLDRQPALTRKSRAPGVAAIASVIRCCAVARQRPVVAAIATGPDLAL